MNEKLVYRFALLFSILTLVCMGVNYYIHPLPTHDGVWTLTPVFSTIQGYWTEDIHTGYRLPFLHYYLKIPFYLVMGNSIYGPFILNIIINLLYVYIIVKFAKKYNLSNAQTWLIVGLFISCNVFISLRPEHLMNILLLLYLLYHSRIKHIWQHLIICILLIAIHPALGLFAMLFNFSNTSYIIKNIVVQLVILGLVGIAIYFIFPELSQTLLFSLQSRYEGNLFIPFLSFCKSCIFIIIYYGYRLYCSENRKRDVLQLLAFIILASLLGKDYYFDYIVIYILYKCIIMPMPAKDFYNIQLALVFVSFTIFPFRSLYNEAQDYDAHSNLKQVLYRIGEVALINDKTYLVPMEFALPAMGNRNVKLLYHNLETYSYTPLVKLPHASILVTNPNKFKETQKNPEAHIKQWIQPLGHQKYCLFEIPSLPH